MKAPDYNYCEMCGNLFSLSELAPLRVIIVEEGVADIFKERVCGGCRDNVNTKIQGMFT